MHRIGLMGGTFDPIHLGHLFAAEEARLRLSLDRILFIPSGTPPHKGYSEMASAEARYEMALLATNSNPCFEVTRIETARAGKSYTVDTLRAVHTLYPGSELFWIVGEDVVPDLPAWKDPFEISSLCTIVVVSRPGFAHDTIEELPEAIKRSICKLDTTLLDISATDIRRRVRQGECMRYILPDVVCNYIHKNNLYYSDGEQN